MGGSDELFIVMGVMVAAAVVVMATVVVTIFVAAVVCLSAADDVTTGFDAPIVFALSDAADVVRAVKGFVTVETVVIATGILVVVLLVAAVVLPVVFPRAPAVVVVYLTVDFFVVVSAMYVRFASYLQHPL